MTEAPTAEPAEIGVYVHWPYCARLCPYCDFNVVRDRGRGEAQAALFRAIVADLTAQAKRLGPRRLASIFFGGGTPSLMEPDWAGEIVATARGLFATAPGLEVTLEANPTDAEAGRFAAFADAGVNRLSLGVQSLDDGALRFLGRNHDAAAARRAAAVAQRAFPRLSIDLIYALPGETPQAWRAALGEALSLQPEHISAYQLTLESGTAFDRAVQRGLWAPPENDAAGALYETTEAVLETAGFEAYEVSNHARDPAARSRHNLIYWRGGDYLGVGPGAHGRNTTPDGGRWSTLTPLRIADYVARVETEGCGVAERTRLTPSEAALERLLMGLRTNEGVAFAELAALRLDAATLAQLRQGGLIEGDGRLIATRRGREVLDRITLELAQSAASG